MFGRVSGGRAGASCGISLAWRDGECVACTKVLRRGAGGLRDWMEAAAEDLRILGKWMLSVDLRFLFPIVLCARFHCPLACTS
jgi:hypothetical protein